MSTILANSEHEILSFRRGRRSLNFRVRQNGFSQFHNKSIASEQFYPTAMTSDRRGTCNGDKTVGITAGYDVSMTSARTKRQRKAGATDTDSSIEVGLTRTNVVAAGRYSPG